MPQQNDPTLVAKTLAKVQSVEDRVNALSAISMDASQGINAGGGTGAGYWIGPTQVINANATFAIGQFAPGVGVHADSAHISSSSVPNLLVDGTSTFQSNVACSANLYVANTLYGTGGTITVGDQLSATHGPLSIHASGGVLVDGTMTAAGVNVTGGGITTTGLTVNNGLQVNGNATVTNVLNAAGIALTGGISAASIHTSGNAQVDGTVTTSNIITSGLTVNNQNAVFNAGISTGSSGISAASIHTSGVGQFDGGISIGGGISAPSIHTSGNAQVDGTVTTSNIMTSGLTVNSQLGIFNVGITVNNTGQFNGYLQAASNVYVSGNLYGISGTLQVGDSINMGAGKTVTSPTVSCTHLNVGNHSISSQAAPPNPTAPANLNNVYNTVVSLLGALKNSGILN